jgi:hypothetical protein
MFGRSKPETDASRAVEMAARNETRMEDHAKTCTDNQLRIENRFVVIEGKLEAQNTAFAEFRHDSYRRLDDIYNAGQRRANLMLTAIIVTFVGSVLAGVALHYFGH